MENMVRRRNALGVSQTGLAKLVTGRGIAFYPQTVQRIELGERPVRLNEAVLIIQALKMSPDESLGLDAALTDPARQAAYRLRQTLDLAGSFVGNVHWTIADFEARASQLEAALDDALFDLGVATSEEDRALVEKCGAVLTVLRRCISLASEFQAGAQDIVRGSRGERPEEA